MVAMNFLQINSVRFTALLLTALLAGRVGAQQTAQLVAQLDSVLVLNADQREKVTLICSDAAVEISAIDKELQSLSRSDLDPADKDKRITDANVRKKAIRESRDAGIRALLTPEQQQVYEEKVKPVRPPVLHFGMNHDRASCEVCVK